MQSGTQAGSPNAAGALVSAVTNAPVGSSSSSTSGLGSLNPASASSTAQSRVPAQKSSTNTAAIGAGLGVPLGLALLVCLFFLW